MGFMDRLKDLTTPYEDDDDFYDGANESYRPAPQEPSNSAEAAFENTFGMSTPAPAPKKPRIRPSFSRQQAKQVQARPQPEYQPEYQPEEDEDYQDDAPASLFGSFSLRRQPKPQRYAQPQGGDPQVTLFNPRTLEDMLKLVTYLQQGRAVFMSLEGVDDGDARRLLDVCTGIALALSCKLTNASARTYFVTPGNVDILSNSQQPGNGYN